MRVTWSDRIQVGRSAFSASDIISVLTNHMTAERHERLLEVVGRRSLKFVPVLENIYDQGNTSAVMRSSEAFGFLQMYLVNKPGARFKAANRVTKGAEKWLDIHAHDSSAATVLELKKRGYKIWATALGTKNTIDSLPWDQPLAVVLGNEKDGVSPEMLDLVDGRFQIPMQGFSQSFNISVAAALIFYRAHLEMRGQKAQLSLKEQQQCLANYCLRCFEDPESILRAKLGEA